MCYHWLMNTEFISFLKEQIGDKSLGQIECMTGVSKSYLSKVLRGLRDNPKPATLKKLAKALPCSYEELLAKALPEEYKNITQANPPQKENTVRIIGRGGVVKEYKVTEEQQKAFELLLASLPKDGIDPDVDF